MGKPNVTTNFLPCDGNWIMKKLAMKASTAMAEGVAIGIEISGNTTTGYYTLMGTENAAGADFTGILAEAIAATDSDYATAGKLKGVWVPLNKEAEATFAVGAGTFTAVDVGKTVEFHSDSAGLAVDTAGKGARITAYISSTRGKCKFVLPTTETA
jgi:hypothetical protein